MSILFDLIGYFSFSRFWEFVFEGVLRAGGTGGFGEGFGCEILRFLDALRFGFWVVVRQA